jgi:8-oxo-dGTP pyrophosphatase MutT (NUDIX family)
MLREISSGGAVLHRIEGVWSIAVIEPRKDDVAGPIDTPEEPRKRKPKTKKIPLALPKGLVDPGEKPEQTALREVREETGIEATLITKLTDIKYVYVRTWSDSERVFKIVSFYLFRYESGRIDDVTEAMRIEVKRALWIPLADATKLLAIPTNAKWFASRKTTSQRILSCEKKSRGRRCRQNRTSNYVTTFRDPTPSPHCIRMNGLYLVLFY